MKKQADKTIIGRAENIDLVDLAVFGVPAKTDTGADSSAIWVSDVRLDDEGLYCIFFGPASEFYTGNPVKFPMSSFSVTRVANSFGEKELRYKVKMRIRVKGRLIRATFTLSDRSRKTYPVLLGRRLLHNKFLVDVTKGQPLRDAEQEKTARLKSDMQRLDREEEKI